MLNYLFRRVLIMIPMLFFISVFVFFLIQLPPGSYVESYISQLRSQGAEVTESQVQTIIQRYGLNQPFYIQYISWVKTFPSGHFGGSFLYGGRRVWDVIAEYLGFTLLVAFSTQLFTIIVGIPIGIYSATHQYTIQDHIVTFLGFIGLSIPNFLLALILMFVGYYYFDMGVLAGLFSDEYIEASWSIGRVIDLLKHLWIPVIVLGTAGTAGSIRVMRGNLLDTLNLQYVQTARAKGLKESIVVYKHAVRNAIHPVIMGLGMNLPMLISGATIVSIVLSLPTLGPILYNALMSQDMYLAGTILLFQSVLLLIGNLLADVALAVVDPRIKYE